MGSRLIVATHNVGKLKEITGLLEGYDLEILSASEASIPEPVESGITFRENAVIKAINAATLGKLPSIADDCGMKIAALGNQPGVASRRFAEQIGSWEAAMRVLDERLQGKETKASFHCALALAWPDGSVVSVEACIEGEFVSPRGSSGAGFDPCFRPLGSQKTYGEMTPLNRNRINHRAQAFSNLTEMVDWLKIVKRATGRQSYSH